MGWYAITWNVILKCQTYVEADNPAQAHKKARDEGWSYDKSYDEQPHIVGIALDHD